MPRAFHDWSEFSPERREFIELWNKQYKERGAYKVMARHFNISPASVFRCIKMFNLKLISDKKHPGRRKFIKRVKRLHRQHESTTKVAELVNFSPQGINRILEKENVSLGEPYLTNPLLFPPKNGMTATKFNSTIQKMFLDEGMNAKQIAKALKCDHNAVCNRLLALKLKGRQNHQLVKGGYPCLWCGEIMEVVWIARGIRKQKYCSSRCKNRCKDYRRYMDAERRIKLFEKELKKNWGDKFEEAKKKVLHRENKGNPKH